MKKSLLVVTLLVAACGLASASSYSFGFASYTGGVLYCNFEQINNNGTYGFAAPVWEGFDNLEVGCYAPYNATISGLTATLASSYLPVHGAGVNYADNIYDAFSGLYTGYQWNVHTALKCNKAGKYGGYKGAWSWIGLASYSNFVFGDNYGFLSCTLPTHNGETVANGPSIGKTAAQLKK